MSGDAAQRPLLWWMSSAMRVRVPPPVGHRARVLLAEGRLPRADVEEPHLDLDAGRHLLHRADDHAVGVQLPPAIERHVGDRRGRGNGRLHISRESARTRARS